MGLAKLSTDRSTIKNGTLNLRVCSGKLKDYIRDNKDGVKCTTIPCSINKYSPMNDPMIKKHDSMTHLGSHACFPNVGL